MSEAGYDPMEMARFFNKLNAKVDMASISLRPPQSCNRDGNPTGGTRSPAKELRLRNGGFKKMKAAVAQIHDPNPSRNRSATIVGR